VAKKLRVLATQMDTRLEDCSLDSQIHVIVNWTAALGRRK